MPYINYRIGLTGSRFFDTVLIMRAKELVKEFENVTVSVCPDKHIEISGDISAENAEKLHAELGCYGN